jgi:hypothetical protein
MVSVPIDRVRVYSRGATVFRKVVLTGKLPPALEVPGLPLSLVDATVRVRSLTAGVVAGAVRIGLHAKPPEETPDTPDELALRAAERRLEVLEQRLEALEAEVDLLRGLEVPPRPRGKEGRPPPASPMRARVALDQFTDSAIQERLDEARGLGRERTVVQEEIAALGDAVRRASLARRARPDQLTKTVLADLSGSAKGEVTLELEYFIPGARWAPQYQCDIARDGSTATLKLRALVCQASGEDWRNVALELSTAEPQAFTELPTLGSIRIGKAQPVPVSRGYREPPQGSGSLYADFDRGLSRARSLMPRRARFATPSLEIEELEDAGMVLEKAAEILEDYDEIEEEMATESMEMALGAMALDDAPSPEPAMAPPRPQSRAMSAMAPPPAPPGRAREMSKKRKGTRREAEGYGGAPSEPPGDRGAPSIAFARLRLSAPSSSSRGTLQPVDRRADYLALLRRSGLEVDFDVDQVVRQAHQQAAAAVQVALPGGAIAVRSAAGRFDYAYRADDRVDVPSDLAFHSVPLGTREASCVVTYVVVPRVDTNVFRVASVDNPTDEPLLPGPTEVYVGGEYVLSTELPVVAPKERFELGLGVEQALRCARNTRFREERSGQNVVAMAELHHEIDIELHNPLARAIQCEIRERIPQPGKDAEVDIEEVAVKPAGEEWDQVEVGAKLVGGRRWTVEVPARSSETLHAHYVVKIYANNEVVGGNRREA